MALGSTISRSLSVKYEAPSSTASTASISHPEHRPAIASRNLKASVVRASTVTSATSVSKLIRSASTASTSRESRPASTRTSSTLRPPSTASKASGASMSRASTVTAATSTSNFIQSGSTSSIVRPPVSAPAASTTSLFRSGSKRAPSYFSTAASRLLWGRPPPGHSTLQPSHIASLTRTLSLPDETPMLSSLVGALGLPISRSQFSLAPDCFCDPHFWLEQQYIEELTEVITHEIGPQLDKLRIAPAELISKKTQRILSVLQPYKDIFSGIGITDSSSFISSSIKPTCPACTLSHFFQNPDAVKALTTCVKGRKHRDRPWPGSMAWLEPCPGKGIDWEAKWKAEGKSIARDRIRVQRWRRETRQHEQQVPEQSPPPQVLGHQPGEGCDFCDNLRLEQADDADLDAAIAEEEEADSEYAVGRLATVAEDETLGHDDDGYNSAHYSETLRDSDDSETLRGMQEESIIKKYMTPSTSSLSSSLKTRSDSVYHHHQRNRGSENESGNQRRDYGVTEPKMRTGYAEDGYGERIQRKTASEWARSYNNLVDRM